jgi:hypothetical protein
MGALIGAVSGLTGRRLLTTTVLPLLAFLAALAVLVAGDVGWATAARSWVRLDTPFKIALTLAALLAALLAAQLLAAVQTGLIRLFEGYWHGLPAGERLAAWGVRRHRAIHAGLTESDPRWAVYPAGESQLMPTTIGNILRGAEEHSADRYGINAITAWPRLYATLPEPFRQAFAAAAADLELTVTLSTLGAVFAVVGTILGAVWSGWVALLCLVVGALVAWLVGRGAVHAAGAYGELFRAAFDVHRWCLLNAAGLTRPTDLAAEVRQWRALDKLWIRGAVDGEEAVHLGYPQPPTGPAQP